MVGLARLSLIAAVLILPFSTTAQTVEGIKNLANRLLQGHGNDFEFHLSGSYTRPSRWNPAVNDNYTVAASESGKIRVEGTTLSALARGLVASLIDNMPSG